MIAPALLFALLLQAAPVQWAVTAPAAGSAAKAGGKLAVTVTATIAPGWHLYSLKKMEGGPIATTIVVPEGQPFRLAGAIDASAPLSKFDDTFQMDVESYEGKYYYIGGQYQSLEGKITGNVSLYLQDTELTNFPISGSLDALGKLSKDLVFEVQAYLKQNPPK